MYRYATHIGFGPAYRTNEEVSRLVKMAIALALLLFNETREDFQASCHRPYSPPPPKGSSLGPLGRIGVCKRAGRKKARVGRVQKGRIVRPFTKPTLNDSNQWKPRFSPVSLLFWCQKKERILSLRQKYRHRNIIIGQKICPSSSSSISPSVFYIT